MIKIIAHRGDTLHFPENTIEAFLAAKKAGADGVELDVHATSDGILVVHHDYYLGHPDNGTGTIKDLPYSSIKNLTIENIYYIPTLEEVFDKVGKKFHYEIELKCLTLDAAEKTVTLAKSHGLLSSIEFTSPHSYLLSELKRRHPTLNTGLFAMGRPTWMDESLYAALCLSEAHLGHYNVVHLQPKDITKEIVAAFHKADLTVHAADCDDKETIIRMKAMGVDQFSTNDLGLSLI